MPFLQQRGNFRSLIAFQKAECIYDITFHFAHRFLQKGDRTIDQMIQAARSGKQNIAEGCSASITSRETEIKLLNVPKASFQELLLDFEDYLRVRNLRLWPTDDQKSRQLRKVCTSHNDSSFYRDRLPDRSDEVIANLAITLIHQNDVMLRKLINAAEDSFIKEGGVREAMYKARSQWRDKK